MVISAIGGTAGVGKTALAVHWAHQAAGRFPDGQLYVNLRGFDPSGNPVDARPRHPRVPRRPAACPPAQIPADPDAQAGLYRSLLAGRRMLIVLDNARDPEQVRPLLPGSPGCLVLVTSRSQLTGLVAAEGAHPLTLDLLSPARPASCWPAAWAPSRLAAEPGAVAELIGLCARLPLALNIAAARAAAQPGPAAGRAGRRAARRPRPADALDTGDAAPSVRAVFSWSYQHLSPRRRADVPAAGHAPGPGHHRGRPPPAWPASSRAQAGDALVELHPRQPAHRARPGPLRLPRPAARLRRRAGPHADDTEPQRRAATPPGA